MEILFGIAVFIFGAIVGSFLNVVVLRYNTGKTVRGRSQCFSCGHTLEWFELVPILSFIFLRGRCAKCKSKISWQYPLVEAATGAIFLATAAVSPGLDSIFFNPSFASLWPLFFDWIIWSILMVIAVYDLKHKIIPDGPVYLFIALSVLKIFLTHPFYQVFQFPVVLDLFAGPILFTVFFLMWLLSRGTWMGFGDAKLSFGIGAFMGFIGGINAVIFGFWIGAAVSVLIILAQKLAKTPVMRSFMLFLPSRSLTMKSEIPFAPFLILGLLTAYFWRVDILNLSVLLSI